MPPCKAGVAPFMGHNADVEAWGLGPEGFCAVQIVAIYAVPAASDPEGQSGYE